MKILAHRGGRAPSSPPENSIAAFEKAIREKVDGIELDVFLVRDKKNNPRLVVFHDLNLKPLSVGNGNITDRCFEDVTNTRLKMSDGSAGQHKIPALDDVLEIVHAHLRSSPDFTLNIEIKGESPPETAKVLADLLEGFPKKNLLVSSFKMEHVRAMQKANPDIPRGILLESSADPYDVTPAQVRDLLKSVADIKPSTVNLTLPSFQKHPELASMIRDLGASPVAWTCGETDPPKVLQKKMLGEYTNSILSTGIDMLITDYPSAIKTALSAQSGMSAAK